MKNNSSYTKSVRSLVYGALTAAMYVVLTYFTGLMGLASGVIQFRISEALCVLPIFFPAAIPGLFIGCLISNLITGCLPWDVVFGSVATLIGAIGAYLMRKIPERIKILATLPTVLANAIIVPIVLIKVYGATDSYPFILLTVSIGEIVCATILGTVLYYALKKTKKF